MKSDYADVELEALDAFTSRFARTSDLLTQRIFRLIDTTEYEEGATFLDALHNAEKRGIIDSAFTFREIRELRNEIAHEYSLRDFAKLIGEIIRLSPPLLEAIEKSIDYCTKFE